MIYRDRPMSLDGPVRLSPPAARPQVTASAIVVPILEQVERPDELFAERVSRESVLEAARAAAYDEAFVEGLAAGEAAGLRQLADAAARLESVARTLSESHETRLGELRDEALAAVFDVVSKVIGDHACSADGLRGLVANAFAELRSHVAVTVRLHPHDADTVRAEWTSQPSLLPPGSNVVGDDSIAFGGCRIDSLVGCVDARLETQIESFKRALLDARSAVTAASTLAP